MTDSAETFTTSFVMRHARQMGELIKDDASFKAALDYLTETLAKEHQSIAELLALGVVANAINLHLETHPEHLQMLWEQKQLEHILTIIATFSDEEES